MTTKARLSGRPLPRREIDRQGNLWRLTKLAERKGFIDKTIKQQIKDFIRTRDKAIHRLAYGEISYDELRDPAYYIGGLISDIQSLLLPIEFSPKEEAPKK